LSYDDRVSEGLRVEADGQTWITSRIPNRTREASYQHGCGLGNLDGEYPAEVICTVEYGEVLLLDTNGQISRAFPMPGAPPDWLEVTADAVYAGRIGDGGLPWSSLARIERATLDIDVIVFPTGMVDSTDGNTWLPDWRFGSEDQLPLLDDLLAGIRDGAFDPATADRLLAAT
jgi:hypothetical protein